MGTIWTPTLAQDVTPKYKAVIASIQSGIQSGALKTGQKLPPVRELAWTLKITPGTVARAYSQLTESGALVAEVGRSQLDGHLCVVALRAAHALGVTMPTPKADERPGLWALA